MAGFDYSQRNKRWQRLRVRALRRDGYQCREAKRFGLRREAHVVHHIWPAEEYPEFAYELWNLLSLADAETHDRFHDRTTRRLTPLGESWRRKTTPPGSAAR